MARLAFRAINNEAEYEELLARMVVARLLGAKEVDVKDDFQVIVNQVLGQFATKGDGLKKYLQLICNERDRFQYF